MANLPATIVPHEPEIRAMLCSGWSAARVRHHMQLVYRQAIPLEDILNYAATIPPEAVLPPMPLAERFKFIDVEVDIMGEAAKVLRLSAERVQDALTLVEVTGEGQDIVNQTLRDYWKRLMDMAQLKQNIGELPSVGKGPEVQVNTTIQQAFPQMTLRELFDTKEVEEESVDGVYKRLGTRS